MTHNGKIGRLPQPVIEQLNRRLDDGEPGNLLVAWLNSQPQIQAILQSEFEGRPIREQNLSEWKKRGYREWQRRQERRELFQELQAGAAELGSVMDAQTFNRQYSMVLAADLALAVRQVLDEVEDPVKRTEALGQLVSKFAQLRREESNAVRAQVARERRDQEIKKEEDANLPIESLPMRALMLQRLYLDLGGRSPGGAGRPGNLSGQAGRSPSQQGTNSRPPRQGAGFGQSAALTETPLQGHGDTRALRVNPSESDRRHGN